MDYCCIHSFHYTMQALMGHDQHKRLKFKRYQLRSPHRRTNPKVIILTRIERIKKTSPQLEESSMVGVVEGTELFVGMALGESDGMALGESDGMALGESDCIELGENDGMVLGDKEAVGIILGMALGVVQSSAQNGPPIARLGSVVVVQPESKNMFVVSVSMSRRSAHGQRFD